MKTSSLWLRAGLALALIMAVAIMLPTSARAGTQAQIKIEQAKVAFSDKDYAGALALANAALAEEPENGEALHYAGLCELALGRPAEAYGLLERSARALPKDAGIFEDMAQAAIAQKKFDAALAAADQALTLDSGRSRANLYKGIALMGLGRNEEALAPLSKVEGKNQQAAQFYSGSALLSLGRTDKAVPFFKKAHDLGPNTELGRKSAEYLEALGGSAGKSKDYSARVRLLYQYDTNIVTVNGDEFLPEDISEMEDSRGVLDADLAWHFVNTRNARASVRYVGYANWQFEETDMNLQYHLGELSGYYIAPAGQMKIKMGAAANYAWAALDNDHYSSSWKTTPYFEIGWNKNSLTGIDVDYGQEEFDEDFEGIGASPIIEDRSNTRTHVTLRQHQQFLDGKLGLLLGYRYGRVWADGRDYNREDHSGLAGVQAALPAKSMLSLLLRYDDRNYPDNVMDRHDRIFVGNLSYEIPIYKFLSFYTGAVYTTVDSNQEALEYERWIFSAGLAATL